MENTYFWANMLEEMLHPTYPVFWEHVSSLSSLNVGPTVSHCLQRLPIRIRLKSHIITGSRDGISVRGYCVLEMICLGKMT